MGYSKCCLEKNHTSCIGQGTMRIRHTHPEQHWAHLLMFFITLRTGALTDSEEIRAPLGGSAPFKFKATKNVTVTLAELTRCPDGKVFVFSPEHGLSITNNSYAGRLSATSNKDTVILEKLQESDFVTYCYKLTTFPSGSLQGQIKLVKKTQDENGLPIILIISVGCGAGFIALCVIIIGVVCYKKRRRNPANTALDTRGQSNPRSTRAKSEDDDFGYLNVP